MSKTQADRIQGPDLTHSAAGPFHPVALEEVCLPKLFLSLGELSFPMGLGWGGGTAGGETEEGSWGDL